MTALPSVTKTWQFWYIFGGASSGLSPQRYVLNQGTAPTITSNSSGTTVVIQNLIRTSDSQFPFTAADIGKRLYLGGMGGGSTGLNTNDTDTYGWVISAVDTTPGTQATKTVTVNYTGSATLGDTGTSWSERTPSTNIALTTTGAAGSDYKLFLRTIKNVLQGFPSNPWTCVGSGTPADSNSFSTTDTVDRVVTNGTATNFFWIILKQTALNAPAPNAGSGFQWLSYTDGSSNGHGFHVSPSAGFTGSTYGAPSTTIPPSATDTVGQFCGSGASAGAMTGTEQFVGTCLSQAFTAGLKMNFMMSSDGQCTRIWSYYQNSVANLTVIETPSSPIASTVPPQTSVWTWNSVSQPWWIFSRCNTGGASFGLNDPARNSYLFNAGTSMISKIGSANTTVTNLQMTSNGGVRINAAWDYTSERGICPLLIYDTTVGHRNRMGYPFDMWLVDSGLVNGDYFGASKQFTVVGEFLFPWDGSTMLTS